ncbi:alpha/beta hydrolase [Microbacterium sp. NPDC077663]|uniref:alpha/beta hydrolase n=1 Tax=Microbacterium sp. NPDC077663 TaxID=3364189 RepID=UPI0037CB8CFF
MQRSPQGTSVDDGVARPPFDPDVRAALDTADDVVVSLAPEEIPTLRARAVIPTPAEYTLEGRLRAEEHVARSADGAPVRLVVLRPRDRGGPLPVIYHVHGGGMVVGTPFDVLPTLGQLALDLGAAIVSVDYRLAPEHTYPAPLDDVYAGLVWMSEHAEDLGLDPDRIVLEGVSAGGGLAAGAALAARDRGGPALLGQMLVYPMLDHRNDSASAHQMAGAGTWDRTANATGWAAYLGALSAEAVPIYASPALADDLSGLPPTFIEVGSAETFRDEDVDYARRIWASGGDAELHVWPGGAHAFDALVPSAPLSRDARHARSRWLQRLLSR